MIIRHILVAFFLALILVMAGCSSNKTKPDDEAMSTSGVEDGEPIDVGADDYSSTLFPYSIHLMILLVIYLYAQFTLITTVLAFVMTR